MVAGPVLVLSGSERAGDEPIFQRRKLSLRAERPLKVIGLEKAELGFELCLNSKANYFSLLL